MTTINSSAAAARENARSTDGKFSHQAHAEAEISLTGHQDPYYGSIAVTAAITETDGFAQTTIHPGDTVRL